MKICPTTFKILSQIIEAPAEDVIDDIKRKVYIVEMHNDMKKQ